MQLVVFDMLGRKISSSSIMQKLVLRVAVRVGVRTSSRKYGTSYSSMMMMYQDIIMVTTTLQ